MPQPSPGLWFLSVRPLNCTGAEDEELYLNVTLSGCINDCGEKEGRGNCQTFYSQGGVLMSSCRCKAGKNSQKFASEIIKFPLFKISMVWLRTLMRNGPVKGKTTGHVRVKF